MNGRLSRSHAFDWGSQAGRDTGQVEKTEQARETAKQVNENFRGIQKFGNERYVNRHNFVPIHGFNKIQNGGVAI